MKDAFGRVIKSGDLVMYATRSGSTQNINIARVKEVATKKRKWSDTETEFVRAECVAGTGYDFKYGSTKWTDDGKIVSIPMTSRDVTLTAAGGIIIVNGIDVDDIIGGMLAEQTANIAEAEARRKSRE